MIIMRDIRLHKLSEREKELNCIYRIIELMKDEERELEDIFNDIIEVVPPGWQHPTICEVMITFEGKEYKSSDFQHTPWLQMADIIIDNHVSGNIQVCYSHNIEGNSNPFLAEEQKLLNTIAERLSMFIFVQRLKKTIELMPANNNKILDGQNETLLDFESDEHSKWRYKAAEQIAQAMDLDHFGVKELYVIGSTKQGQAGPSSDIDLLIYFVGDENQKRELCAWLKGWGLGLSEVNYIKSGYRLEEGLVDFHIITDEDIREKTSYAVMIGSADNSARLLKSK
jgi:predicted nucleotidyltransferase